MRQSSIHMVILSAKSSVWASFTGEFVICFKIYSSFLLTFRYVQFSDLRHHGLNGKNY